MLQSAITIVLPILYIFQKYYQDYQKLACTGAVSVKEAKSKKVHENPLETERVDCTEKCVYTIPTVNSGDTKLFPPPISCLSLLNESRRSNYYKLNVQGASFPEEEVILPDRGIMSCLAHNSCLKMWYPRRPGVEGQQNQEGDDDEEDDDDDSSDDSSSESDYYYTTSSDEDMDDDDDDGDTENPDHDGDEPIDKNDDNDNDEHYRNDIGADREGNANNEGGNENSNTNNTS